MLTRAIIWLKRNYFFLPILLFIPSLFNFFSGDDWFHLRITQTNSLREFLNFFSFSHTAQSATFYRPLSTQVFFYVFQKLFGLTAWPYYLFILICFTFSIYLVYRFISSQLKDNKKGSLAAFFYALSVSNFTRIYFLSAFQEIFLVIFSLLCLLSFPKSKIKSIIFFILALMSKETAIILPILLLVFYPKEIKKKNFSFLILISLSAVYCYLRFVVFGLAQGDSYTWNFSPYKAANSLMWYSLWSLGAPELLVDYIGSGFKPIARFYTDFPVWWPIIITTLSATIFSLAALFFKNIKKIPPLFLNGILFFLISISPVIFLPQHKFTLELGLPLVGFVLCLSILVSTKRNIFSICFVLAFLILNTSMNYLTYSHHYSVSRANISRNVFVFLNKNYPIEPKDKYFFFVNDTGNYGAEWGQSKQISQALSGSDFFKVYYKDRQMIASYQDVPANNPIGQPINLSSQQFLSQ